MYEIYANALLKEGKIMFWWTGDRCNSEEDFYKDFYYSGMNMMKELETGKYTLERQKVPSVDSVEAKEFYMRFEIHEQSKGRKPY